MVYNNEEALNKIPLKSVSDDEEKNGGEFARDICTVEESRREAKRSKWLKWMKKLTIALICFIGIALIAYVIFSLSLSEWAQTKGTTHNGEKVLLANSAAFEPLPSNTTLQVQTPSTENIPISKHSEITSKPPLLDNLHKYISTISAGRSEEEETSSTISSLSNQDNESTESSENKNDFKIDNWSNSEESSTPSNSINLTDSSDPEDPEETTMKISNSVVGQDSDESDEFAKFMDIAIKNENFSSTLGVYQKCAVCSDREVCSQIGSKILQQGGTAVDAAISVMLCNGITIMHSMGIGGGMLMNIYIKSDERAYSVDAREVAPYAATSDLFNNKQDLNEHGALTIAVPGELKGYHKAHQRFGKLPWKDLVEPSINLCESGFYMTPHIFQAVKYRQEELLKTDDLREMLFDKNTNTIKPLGSKLYPVKNLCNTYRLLAENGPLDFYNGTLSKMVIKDLEEINSLVTADDLESYRADIVSSISMPLGDDILYALPPISSGTIVANILSTLEGFNFTANDLKDLPHEANLIHLMVEAMKFSFAKRWELGDVRFNDVRELVSRLTSPETGEQMRAQINKTYVLKNIYEYGAQHTGEDDMGTSHVSILAPNGDAVSATSSINEYYGSCFVGRKTGIIFNNGMKDFSIPGQSDIFNLPPSPINFIDAQKRPMSSMSPMILTDSHGNVRIVVGAAGGSKIISSVVEVIARVIWLGQNIKEAIDAPRFHHQLVPNVLQYEKYRFSTELLRLLQSKGHHIEPHERVGSVVCGIVQNETAIYSNADYRKQGGTAGF